MADAAKEWEPGRGSISLDFASALGAASTRSTPPAVSTNRFPIFQSFFLHIHTFFISPNYSQHIFLLSFVSNLSSTQFTTFCSMLQQMYQFRYI